MKLKKSNQPLHGLGEHGSVRRKGGLMGVGHHMPQRVESGFDDARGYEGSKKVNLGKMLSGAAPKLPREAGHYHPVGHGATRVLDRDIMDTHKINAEITGRGASARRDGYHTGEPSEGDTNIRKGKTGNAEGSAPPGIGRGKGVNGSPDSHLGTAGRGAPGKFGKGDAYKAKQNPYPEDISHQEFERLGAK